MGATEDRRSSSGTGLSPGNSGSLGLGARVQGSDPCPCPDMTQYARSGTTQAVTPIRPQPIADFLGQTAKIAGKKTSVRGSRAEGDSTEFPFPPHRGFRVQWSNLRRDGVLQRRIRGRLERVFPKLRARPRSCRQWICPECRPWAVVVRVAPERNRVGLEAQLSGQGSDRFLIGQLAATDLGLLGRGEATTSGTHEWNLRSGDQQPAQPRISFSAGTEHWRSETTELRGRRQSGQTADAG